MDASSSSAHAQPKDKAAANKKGTRRTSRTTSTGDRKKRQRVTSDQLAQLENAFAVDRMPTQERRREISQMLGMDERQTKIWFQNRRAKLNREVKEGIPTVISPDRDALMKLFREQEGVTFVPCSDLRIGKWRRIRDESANDLAAYICYTSRSLCWFVHAGGRCYEMVMPLDTIAKIVLEEHTDPDLVYAAVTLTNPPTFWYDEQRGVYGEDPWQEGVDWTENQQATCVLTHIAIGSKPHFREVQRLVEGGDEEKDQPSPLSAQGTSLSPMIPSERQQAAAMTQSHLGRGHPVQLSYPDIPPIETDDEPLPPVPFAQPPHPSQSTMLAAPVPTKPPLIPPTHHQSYMQPWSAGPPSTSPPRTTSSEISAYSLPPLPLTLPPQPQPQTIAQRPPPSSSMMPPNAMATAQYNMPPPPPPHTMPPTSMTASSHAHVSQQAVARRAVSYQMPERVAKQSHRHGPYDAAAAHSARRASTGSALQPPTAYGSGTYQYGQMTYEQSAEQYQQRAQHPAHSAPGVRRLSVSFGQQQPVEMRMDDDAPRLPPPDQYSRASGQQQPMARESYTLPPPSAYGSGQASAYITEPPPYPSAPADRFPPVPPPQSYQAPEPASSRHTPQGYAPDGSASQTQSRAPSPEPTHRLPDSPLLTKPWIPPPHILEGLKRDAEAAEAEKKAEAARRRAEQAQKAAEAAQRAAEEAQREAEEAAQREVEQRERARAMLPAIQEVSMQDYGDGGAYRYGEEYYPSGYGAAPVPPLANYPAPTAPAAPSPTAGYVYDPTTGMYRNVAYQYR